MRLGQARGEDVADLIARKQYAKAIEIIKAQLGSEWNDPRIRLQLADVLVMAGRPPEAVAVLIPLADEYARDGFAAKAVAVLKRIQKIDPRRRDIESRIASLIEQKQRHATVPIAASPSRMEFGFEEIQPGLELGFEPLEEGSVAEELPLAPPPPPPPPRAAAPPPPAPVEDHDLAFGDGAVLELEPEVEPDPAPAAPSPPSAEPEIVLDPDPEPLVLEPIIEAEPIVETEAAEAGNGGDPLGDDLFAQELMSVLEGAFPGPAPEPEQVPPGLESADGGSFSPSGGGRQIVVSPLFRDFSVDEMVAVIQGLKLLSYESGEIIISEGEPGDSLYMLSAGRVKAFKRNPAGKQALLGEMSEGAFFGEISVLTGKPRSATVVAATTCELLELDRDTLHEITATHPHVWDVLREYAERRMKNQK